MLLALVVLWLAAPVSAVLPVYRFMVVVFPRPVVPTWSNKYIVGSFPQIFPRILCVRDNVLTPLIIAHHDYDGVRLEHRHSLGHGRGRGHVRRVEVERHVGRGTRVRRVQLLPGDPVLDVHGLHVSVLGLHRAQPRPRAQVTQAHAEQRHHAPLPAQHRLIFLQW